MPKEPPLDEPDRGGLGEGAAEGAPTAPHATPRANRGRRSGPERFWSRGPTRIAFLVSLVLSTFAHGLVAPLDLPSGIEVHDVEGEAAIAVDLLSGEAAEPPPAAPPAPEPPSPPHDDEQAGAHPAAPSVDAGAHLRPHPAADAAADVERDGAASGADGGAAATEAGGEGGARDPEAIAGGLQTDVILVSMLINAEVIRKNPVGASLGSLLRAIPQWSEFMSGTDIDPIRDADWVMVSGPSLVNTGHDVVLIRYAAPDSVVDRAIATVSRRYERGGPFDAGVPGVRATLAHADRAERALLRPGPHVLAVVAPSAAAKVARQLAASRIPAHVLPGQAFFMRFVAPHRALPEIPESITELRVRIVPRADDGVDVHAEGDANDAEAAAQDVLDVARAIRRHNTGFTSLLTHGLLDNVEVTRDGRRVLVELGVSRDQLEALASLASAFLGGEPPDTEAIPEPTARAAPHATPRAPAAPSSGVAPRAPRPGKR